ncbi:MAG: sialidase family protein, partial [Planctomycetota bacterium]|nr:sialidase family protein [Planctomycetota bacterium]
MKRFFPTLCLSFVCLACTLSVAEADRAVFVDDGRIKAACAEGKTWNLGNRYIECVGEGNVLFAGKHCGRGDFHVTVELSIGNLGHTAASMQFGNSHFGFDGKGDRLFVQGKLFGPTKHLGKRTDFFSPDKPFRFEAIRKGDTIRFLIDGKQAYQIKNSSELGRMGLRPWRGTMRVSRFAAEGNLLDTPCPVPRTQPDAYTIPTIDLSHQKHRQVVVERIPGKYLGHPTTVLMDDGKTIYCTYPLGHGGPAAVLKKSSDGGLTWSERLPVPKNWKTARNCPCLHRLTGPSGKERLFVFEGNGAMRQARSEDGGKTWTPFKPNGLHCVVAPITILPISGKRHLAMYHRGRGDHDRPPLELWQAVSSDGGLIWADERKVADYPSGNPCEPFVIRSPDGKQLAALARENARRYNSLLITSNDEGKTWSKPVELPAALTGDRHMGRYAADGRLVLCFRDTTLTSPTKGDFVAWVGTYDDIVNLREGQYRVRLLRSPKKGDLGYPGVELLPDGTFVATTYAVLAAGEKNSVVSVRFKLSEIDAEAKRLPVEENLFVSGKNGYDTYRIPALAVTNKGSVLAFCEGRKKSRGDTGNIDMLLRRGTDGGRTFSKQRIVWDDGPNTCGNPCPVVDRETGTIWLLMTHNLGEDRERQIIAGTSKGTRSVWVCKSSDDGRTWSKPVDITATTKKPGWTWYATGPGTGIQLRDGRLVVPCDHIVAGTKAHNSHIIYSD